MHFFEISDGHPGVDLGRFQGLMTKQLLHGPDIGLVSQHGRGAGVAEGMGRDILLDLRLVGVFFHHLPDHIFGQLVAPGRKEQRVVVRIPDQLRILGGQRFIELDQYF